MLTARERRRLVRLLDDSLLALRQAVGGLDAAGWSAAPPGGGWTPQQHVDHLLRVESAVSPRILLTAAADAAEAEAARAGATDRRRMPRLPRPLQDLVVRRLVAANVKRVVSPHVVRPISPDAPPAALLAALADARGSIAAFARTTGDDLRRPAGDHPFLGPLDRYQWALFLGAHTQRHVTQLRRPVAAGARRGAG